MVLLNGIIYFYFNYQVNYTERFSYVQCGIEMEKFTICTKRAKAAILWFKFNKQKPLNRCFGVGGGKTIV
ncbi:MAG: hypothetical protein CMH46_09710 [Muricauda sp.]|nr:hypothetical protein [Allomuricauda sp.]